jgi:hypothetical protein
MIKGILFGMGKTLGSILMLLLLMAACTAMFVGHPAP